MAAATAASHNGMIAKVMGGQVVEEVLLSGDMKSGLLTVTTSDGSVVGTVSVKSSDGTPVLKIGKVVESGREITLYTEHKTMHVKKIHDVALTEEQKDKAINIASGDPKVQELIKETGADVNDLTILSVGPTFVVDEESSQAKVTGATIWVALGDRCYLMQVSFESSSVTNIYPVSCPSATPSGEHTAHRRGSPTSFFFFM